MQFSPYTNKQLLKKQCIISPKLGNCTDMLKHNYMKNYFNEKHTYICYNTTKKPHRI